MVWIGLGAVALLGCLQSVNSAVNGLSGRRLGIVRATGLFLAVGAVLSVLLSYAFENGLSASALAGIPPYLFVPGAINIVFIATQIRLVNAVGAMLTQGSIVAGQMIMSLVLDHIGLAGLPVLTATFSRVLGVGVLLFGVWLLTTHPRDPLGADEKASTSMRSAPSARAVPLPLLAGGVLLGSAMSTATALNAVRRPVYLDEAVFGAGCAVAGHVSARGSPIPKTQRANTVFFFPVCRARTSERGGSSWIGCADPLGWGAIEHRHSLCNQRLDGIVGGRSNGTVRIASLHSHASALRCRSFFDFGRRLDGPCRHKLNVACGTQPLLTTSVHRVPTRVHPVPTPGEEGGAEVILRKHKTDRLSCRFENSGRTWNIDDWEALFSGKEDPYQERGLRCCL